MGRIVHIALKCNDRDSFEKSTKFYEEVFGIYQTKTDHARGHLSRHMTDGNIDLALMLYDSENEKEAKLAGAGARIHHIGIEVTDRASMIKKIEDNGGTIFSDRAEGALKYHSPDGSLGEIVGVGRYPKKDKSKKGRIAHVNLNVNDLDVATTFYENVFEFKQLKTIKDADGRLSRHMTDGETDITLTVYGSGTEDQNGLGIQRWGLEVPNQNELTAEIVKKGGTILSKLEADILEFRGPDGNIAAITSPGGFEKYELSA